MSTKAPRAVERPELISKPCPFCGETVRLWMFHYDKLYCSCGKWLWTLRPKKAGPLVLLPHPSLNESPGI